MNKKTDIKHPYSKREFIFDLLFGIPTSLYYNKIAVDIDLLTGIITTITIIFIISILHYDILTRWNRRMYHQNKIKRIERRLNIQKQQEEEEWSYYDL